MLKKSVDQDLSSCAKYHFNQVLFCFFFHHLLLFFLASPLTKRVNKRRFLLEHNFHDVKDHQATHSKNMPDILDDRYQLAERLGEGGMAEVYRAEDIRLGRPVAVKILRQQYSNETNLLRRFINEARSIAGFSHPNVVSVYDVGRDKRYYYIVMEYVPGEDLRQRLEREERLSVDQALDIVQQMAQGIGYAHQRGLVHRDIKPGNILITEKGHVKVADFGIAKALASAGLTEPGVVWGTTAYLSPEQVRGEQATTESDVYAMGIVLYEILSGLPPFQGEDRVAIALKHLHDDPPPFDDDFKIPHGVAYLVQKALAKDPAKRFQDADEMAEALADYMRAGDLVPTAGPSDGNNLPSNRPRTRHANKNRLTPRLPQGNLNRKDPSAPTPQQVPEQESGMDWITLLLGILALISVLGLYPLFQYIFNFTP